MADLNVQLARLATLLPAELRIEWRRLHGADAPNLSDDLLLFGLAYRIQEKAIGSLAAKSVRQLVRTSQGKPTSSAVKPGTRFVRSWKGRTIAAEATDDGFRFEDRTYASLSAIAREVTSAHWSGPRFFGLRANG